MKNLHLSPTLRPFCLLSELLPLELCTALVNYLSSKMQLQHA